MRYLSMLLALSFITTFAQPGPPPLYLTVVKDAQVLLPLDTIPQVSLLFSQGPGDDGITPRSLGPSMDIYPSPMFQDEANSWRMFETNLHMNRNRVVQVVHQSDTMLLSIPMNEDSLRRCVHERYRHGAILPIRFVPGSHALLSQMKTEENLKLFHLLENRFFFENPKHSVHTRKRSVGITPQSINRIILSKASIKTAEKLSALVTGQVQLDETHDGTQALLGIYPTHSFKGTELSPCNPLQVDGGLNSALWHDHKVIVSLNGLAPGAYKLVVCGVGEGYFQISMRND